jgi:hypothetical protein
LGNYIFRNNKNISIKFLFYYIIMGSGIKMSVLLFSFALISAISIDDLPEKNNVYVKPAVVIDEKSVEYKLDDLNIIQPMYVIIPKDRNESFVGPPTHHEDNNRKLLEDIQLDTDESDDGDKESDDENTGSRRLLKKKSSPPAPAPAPKKAPAPAPAPKKAPAPTPAPKKAPAPAPAPKKAPAPPAPKATPPPPAPKVSIKVEPVIAVSPTKVLESKPSSQNFKIFMTCDNEFDLYVNGEKVGKGDTWTKTYEFNTIVNSGDVIAIDGVDKGGPAGFIGVFNGKITKSSEWRCSTQKFDNWNKNNFDDSKWNTATSYGKNNQQNIWMSVGNGPRPNIPSDAEWLWTNNNENHDRIYCRFFYNGRPTSAPAPTPAPAAAKAVLANNEKKLDNWLNTDKGKEAVDFCKSLGIFNKNKVYMGCLEDMMVIKDKNVAKESALSAEEVISSDHEGTNRRFCQASGDPHVTNYDGSYFHIQEQGIYTVAKTDGFEVQEKIKKNGENKAGVPSCMIGALVKSGSIIIEVDVYSYKKVVINGESVDIQEGLTKTFGGVQVKYGKQTIEWKGQKATATGMKIITKNGFMVMIQGSYCGVLEVNVPIPYYGKMSGICGNADGNKNVDDFKGSDGKVMDVNYGGKSWEMSGYGGPTAPLSKWQLSWKPLGSSCYFVSGCELAPVVAPAVKPATAPAAPSTQIKQDSSSQHHSSSMSDNSKKVKQLLDDMKKTHTISNKKLESLKTNVLKLVNNEQKKLESELSDSKKVVLLTGSDVEKLKAKYNDKIKEYRALNETITKLEKVMMQHYQQMESDSKYLLLLEKIKPSFLGTLQSFGKMSLDVKNTIVSNIVEGGDKEYMLRLLYDMTDKTNNSTSVISSEFIKHYEKYKKRVGVDKDEYDKEYKELLIFKEKYISQRKLKNLLLKDYKNALNILKKLQINYNFDEEDIKSFNQLSNFIKNIFDYKKC